MTEIRDRRQKHWFWVDDAVIDEHAEALGPFGLAVYMILVRHADKYGQSFPSLPHLQKLLGGAGRNTIRRALSLLVERGLVNYEPRKDASGRSTSHRYTLLTVSTSEETTVTKSLADAAGEGSTMDPSPAPHDPREGEGSTMDRAGSTTDPWRGPQWTGEGSTVDPKGIGFKETPIEGDPSPQTPPPTGEGPDALALGEE